MKRIEYIKQFRGLENRTVNQLDCPREYGLDKEDNCGHGCKDCFDREAMIGGKPAPYMFACPVKPGQTIYEAIPAESSRIDVYSIESVAFHADGTWEALGKYGEFIVDSESWMRSSFPTVEEAEDGLKKMKEMYEDYARRLQNWSNDICSD